MCNLTALQCLPFMSRSCSSTVTAVTVVAEYASAAPSSTPALLLLLPLLLPLLLLLFATVLLLWCCCCYWCAALGLGTDSSVSMWYAGRWNVMCGAELQRRMQSYLSCKVSNGTQAQQTHKADFNAECLWNPLKHCTVTSSYCSGHHSDLK